MQTRLLISPSLRTVSPVVDHLVCDGRRRFADDDEDPEDFAEPEPDAAPQDGPPEVEPGPPLHLDGPLVTGPDSSKIRLVRVGSRNIVGFRNTTRCVLEVAAGIAAFVPDASASATSYRKCCHLHEPLHCDCSRPGHDPCVCLCVCSRTGVQHPGGAVKAVCTRHTRAGARGI